MENYKEALRNLSWEDTDEGFYEWLAVEAGHNCTPQHSVFKDVYKLWTGNDKATYASGYCSQWNEKRAFYTNLCAYGCLF